MPEIKWQQPQNRKEGDRISGILKMSQAHPHAASLFEICPSEAPHLFPHYLPTCPLSIGSGAGSPQGSMEKRPKVDNQSWDVWVLQVRVRPCLTGNLRFPAAWSSHMDTLVCRTPPLSLPQVLNLGEKVGPGFAERQGSILIMQILSQLLYQGPPGCKGCVGAVLQGQLFAFQVGQRVLKNKGES